MQDSSVTPYPPVYDPDRVARGIQDLNLLLSKLSSRDALFVVLWAISWILQRAPSRKARSFLWEIMSAIRGPDDYNVAKTYKKPYVGRLRWYLRGDSLVTTPCRTGWNLPRAYKEMSLLTSKAYSPDPGRLNRPFHHWANHMRSAIIAYRWVLGDQGVNRTFLKMGTLLVRDRDLERVERES